MPSTVVGSVRIRSGCAKLLETNSDRILVLFSAELRKNVGDEDAGYVDYEVQVPGNDPERKPVGEDFVDRLQKYVDDICREGCVGSTAGDDSSYDSDYEVETSTKLHHDVSRTTSDTLAAEFAEYVQTDNNAGYTARVEFALKLGYTEKLVQAALAKLGPSPDQNELLAELIKLGAQRGGSSCDSSPTDNIQLLEQQELPSNDTSASNQLRPIVIDGSNVAVSHGNKETFSCRGIKICVDWFKARGHRDITVFVPKWRKEAPRPDNLICDQEILAELERERLLVFTPSRLVGGKRMVCYDDRYILKLAAEVDGIVVSNDNYRDLCQESSDFRKVVEERVLMYSFVNDRFMPPDDPLGRSGPTLDNFLRKQPKKGDPPPPCPYGKKCTYGNKCKYHHPERGPLPHKSVTERLSEHAQRHLLAREMGCEVRKTPLGRTKSGTAAREQNQQQHPVVAKSRSVDNVGGATREQQPENLHRKLQRQLTLNPTSDPRLQRRYIPQQQQSPSTSHYVPFPHHQHVTRIASAPDSYQQPPWMAAAPTSQQQHQQHRHMQRISSCSDPQLNVWPQWVASPQMSAMEEARRKLHYHLAAIFPEEQVVKAMQLYPEETNPQKICAAILAMFPKS